MRMNWLALFAAKLAVVLSASAALAAEPKVTVVAEGLDNPSGIAVQPGTGHVFVASHAGVQRLDPKTGKLTDEVTGYPTPTDIYGKGPKYPIGPLGLAFLDQHTLIVGDGSRVDGEELVRVYKVGDTAAAKAQKEDAAAVTLGPIAPCEKSPKGEGNFYGVATNGSTIAVSCNGDDTKGWVALSKKSDGKWGKLELAIATKEAVNVDAPGPVAYSKDGKHLIVGQIGEVNQAGDSLLTIYGEDGKLAHKVALGLNDICGLAVHPKSGKWFGTDFSWIDATKGGLFAIDAHAADGKAATKVISLDKPTGLAFDANGDLFIAVFGKADGKPTGQIVKVSGL